MCNRRSLNATMSELELYYSAEYSEEVDGMSETDGQWEPAYHINAFDFSKTPVITSKDPKKIQLFNWGLIPYKTKSMEDAVKIRQQTIMARSEDMFERFSFQDLAKAGKRCLIPATGYFEHYWSDEKGKNKIPYFIFLKLQPVFSIGGLYSKWTDPATGKHHYTYTICTTEANTFTAKIHNTGKRMPVILESREKELAWLNPLLSKDEVQQLCTPIPDDIMDAYTVSKVITSRNANVKEAIQPFQYPELNAKGLFD